jgi:hypothetical protein
MELTAKQKKSQELLQKIITKAWEDKSFKEELIAKPIEAIEELTGEKINLPEGKTILDLELNEKQLEAIAGGTNDNNDFPWWVFVKEQLLGGLFD